MTPLPVCKLCGYTPESSWSDFGNIVWCESDECKLSHQQFTEQNWKSLMTAENLDPNEAERLAICWEQSGLLNSEVAREIFTKSAKPTDI